jgi:hypothetical protein
MIAGHPRIGVVIVAAGLSCAGCGPRLNLVTGTTVGLKASPGNGTALPQVTLAYKRSESAVIPTRGASAVASAPGSNNQASDAYSALTAYFLQTSWFGKTTLESFISTGPAAQNLAKPNSAFQEEFAAATLKKVDAALQKRKQALAADPVGQDEQKAQRILDLSGYTKQPGLTASQSLASAIGDANTDGAVAKLEAAFFQVQH